ncbi:MAG: hypothetical protein CMK59_00610 [Proteobacteria bacterium]|nr:hypothetical protein [Pseudomonadota bacterium]
MKKSKTKKRAQKLILRAASRIFGEMGYDGASVQKVADEAGVSKSLVHYHFHTKEKLLLEAQKTTFRELHRRISEGAKRGDIGLRAALSALDSMWESIRDLREGAPFVVETLSLAGKKKDLQPNIRAFYEESTALLSDGIKCVFAEDLERLAIPPDRMAILLRIVLEGLTVELAQVQTTADLRRVDQAYADMRKLFGDFVILKESQEITTGSHTDENIPLPW